MYSAVILNSKLDYWSCLKKDSSVPFLHHNPSKLNNKRPDSDHPKAQGLDKRPQAIFVSGRISELTSATSLSVNDKKKITYYLLADLLTYTIIIWRKIIAAIYATYTVVKRKPEKNSGLYGIRTLDLYDTCAALYHLS